MGDNRFCYVTVTLIFGYQSLISLSLRSKWTFVPDFKKILKIQVSFGGVLFKSVIHVDVSVIFYEEQHEERSVTSHVGYCHLGFLCF